LSLYTRSSHGGYVLARLEGRALWNVTVSGVATDGFTGVD